MVEFDFIRRILKARFQKFFKENKPLFRTLSEQSSLDRDSHLEEFYRFHIRANSFNSCSREKIRLIRVICVRNEEHSLINYVDSCHDSAKQASLMAFAAPRVLKFLIMIKVNWTKVAKVLKLVATVITSVLGTLAVQSCVPHLF